MGSCARHRAHILKHSEMQNWCGWKVPQRCWLLILSGDQLPAPSCCPHTSTNMVQAGGKKTLLCFSLGALNWRHSYPSSPDRQPPDAPWSTFLASPCQQVSSMNFSLLWPQFLWCYLLLGLHPLTGTFLPSWIFCSSCCHMLIGPVINCPISHHLVPPPRTLDIWGQLLFWVLCRNYWSLYPWQTFPQAQWPFTLILSSGGILTSYLTLCLKVSRAQVPIIYFAQTLHTPCLHLPRLFILFLPWNSVSTPTIHPHPAPSQCMKTPFKYQLCHSKATNLDKTFEPSKDKPHL